MPRFVSIDGKPVLWTDPDGVIHACDGAGVEPGEYLLWTLCGRHDVPAGKHPAGRIEDITCSVCAAMVAPGSKVVLFPT